MNFFKTGSEIGLTDPCASELICAIRIRRRHIAADCFAICEILPCSGRLGADVVDRGLSVMGSEPCCQTEAC
jgi:hypothetical protein